MLSVRFLRSLMFSFMYAVAVMPMYTASVLATVGSAPTAAQDVRRLQLMCDLDGGVLAIVAPWGEGETRAQAETYARAYIVAQWPSARIGDVHEIIEQPRAPSDGQ